VKFYGYLDFINALQKSRPEYKTDRKMAEFNAQYLRTLAEFLREFEHAFDDKLRQAG
jgi:hypothetical protein